MFRQKYGMYSKKQKKQPGQITRDNQQLTRYISIYYKLNIYPDNPFFISQNSFKKASKSSCGEIPNRPFNRPFALVTESEVV